ncbi:Uu.00g098720.m01.CDS01 [Anthostomella pinea]|uniref:Uu.00g098720.m01.CDS01 n=1 Tax=Anthostomella pinea TaxID=933095 RepID=A0AAI8V7L0_9PEZI|nr:Uu.00g098720.m01.CDS01 [Anthostomella pinea]
MALKGQGVFATHDIAKGLRIAEDPAMMMFDTREDAASDAHELFAALSLLDKQMFTRMFTTTMFNTRY